MTVPLLPCPCKSLKRVPVGPSFIISVLSLGQSYRRIGDETRLRRVLQDTSHDKPWVCILTEVIPVTLGLICYLD